MSDVLPPIPQNIAEMTAPLLLGIVLNWCLYGTLMVQFYVYTYNFPTDRRFLKLLGRGIPRILPSYLSLTSTALSGADLYYWFVSGFGDMNHLASPYASSFDVTIIGSVVSLTVQFFFAYRLWLLGNKKYWCWCLSGVICVISTVDATAAFAGGVYTHVRGRFASGRWLKILAMTWLIGNAAADTLIASAMLYHLVRLKKKDGYFSGHALISIVRLTVETNILTTTVSIVAAIMVIWHPVRDS
ncbi:hypothetical protein BJY52DRAFT_1194050 [Lactarius psammicola]|nr:hypothetical protein BJY52DRAFT_1194050 [Lactarius psammicola]